MTRLSSSSPVAATTTSQRSSPALAQRRDLARVGDDPLDAVGGCGWSRGDDLGVLLEQQHLVAVSRRGRSAMNAPTLPAPAIATRISAPPPRLRRAAPGARRAPSVVGRRSAARRLPGRRGRRSTTCAAPRRVTAASQNAARSLELGQLLAGPLPGSVALDERDPAGRVGPVAASSPGSRRRSTWSVVHATVATVGMPSRW